MDFLADKTEELPGEAVVKEISLTATKALADYTAAAAKAFALLWGEPAATPHFLARMGTRARLGFDQHADTVMHLLRSHARANAHLATVAELSAMLTNPPGWMASNPAHALTAAVLTKMPPATFTPPSAFTAHSDGTITLDP
jgi:hypothetical protein